MLSDSQLLSGIPLLSVTGLSKAYGPKMVLDGVDLSLDAGRLTLVTGPNGSGKSTLLRCLAGLARYEGEVLMAGRPVSQGRSRIGYLPQTVGLPDWATVGEVLHLFARLRGVERADTILPAGFLPDEESPVRVLSGGQTQRVALAVALLGFPSVLLLDEPAANLDDEGRSTLWQVLGEVMEAGSAVLVAAPSGPDTRPVADRVVVLSEGRLRSPAQAVMT